MSDQQSFNEEMAFGPRRRATYACSYCNKTQDQVARLIAGPEGVIICDECIALFAKESVETLIDQQVRRCSFCGKDQTLVKRIMVSSSGVVICDECDDLCIEIIEEEQKTVARPKESQPGNSQPDSASPPDSR